MMHQGVLIANLQKHRPRKQAVPSLLRDDPHRQAVIRVRAREDVLHKNVAPLQITLQTGEQRAEIFPGEWPVVLAPPDLVVTVMLMHHELVGRCPRRVLTGRDHQRPQVRQAALRAENALLVERRRR